MFYGLVQYDEIVYETEEFKIERCLRSDFFNVTNDQVCEVLKKLNLLKEKEKNNKNYQKTSIEKDGKKYFGLLDETGEHLLVPCIICADDCSFYYEDGYVIYRKGDSKGIMNLKGKVIVPAQYSAIIPLNKYLAFALWDDGEFYNREYSEAIITLKGLVLYRVDHHFEDNGLEFIEDEFFKIYDHRGFDIYRCIEKEER